MKVIIETIPHEQQPYDTCGDWRFENHNGEPISQKVAMEYLKSEVNPVTREFASKHNPTATDFAVLRIRVSRLGDWRYEMLVAVHELIETLMCMHDGVKVEDVDAFDKAFEAAREEGNEDEPGDDPKAPYVRQHCIATSVERLLCAMIGCDWKTYDAKVFSLPTIPTKE